MQTLCFAILKTKDTAGCNCPPALTVSAFLLDIDGRLALMGEIKGAAPFARVESSRQLKRMTAFHPIRTLLFVAT